MSDTQKEAAPNDAAPAAPEAPAEFKAPAAQPTAGKDRGTGEACGTRSAREVETSGARRGSGSAVSAAGPLACCDVPRR